jgi:DNA-binding CsgD family transcriptional regulator
MNILEHEFASLYRARTEQDLRAELERFTHGVGFEHFVYVLNVSELLPSFQPVILNNYPQGWGDRYLSGNYSETDPLIRRGRHSAQAIIWSDYQIKQDDSVLDFWEEAREFGLVGGLSFAIHSQPGITGMFSICRDKAIDLDRDGWSRLIGETHTFAAVLHELVCQRHPSRMAMLGDVELTRAQRAVMRWIAAGKTAEETGRIMSMTKFGVTFHLNNVKVLLKATNTAQAIARAVTLGLL